MRDNNYVNGMCVVCWQSDLMEWLHLWSSWYQVQCGVSSSASVTATGDNASPVDREDESEGESDDEEEEEDDMSSDYGSSEEDELSSEDDSDAGYGRTKRQKTKRRQRTGGHIDGVSNVLLLEGTARAKMFLFPVHN